MTPDNLQHHYIANTALAYAPNSSVTDKTPQFFSGSNIMTSTKDHMERRPGFPPWLADTTFTFSGSLQRFFTWRRWTGAAVTLSGAYFVMYNDTSTTASRVWKQRLTAAGVPVDAYPVLINTDSASANAFDFVVSNDYLFFGNGDQMKKWDGTTVTNWGIAASSTVITTTSSAGALSPVIGFQWQFSFENSSSTHMSSPNPPSVTTGAQSLKQFNFGGITTTDPQVDRVRVFRTVDGGSIYFELPNSPVSYATWLTTGITDNNLDTALSTAVSPLPNQNNVPTPSQGCVWFANRIWTFFNDTLYYSDFEELVRGVEEESFASTNSRFIGREITGLAVAGTFLLIYTADAIYRIYGDSLATFRFDTLAIGKGALNIACIVPFKGMVAWLDASNCVFVTDGQTVPDTDLSDPIRTDILNIVHASAFMAFFSSGNRHWLILGDGSSDVTGKLWVFDLDTGRWMPPWQPPGKLTALYGGQTAPATYQLFLAAGTHGKPLAQSLTNYVDDATPFSATFNTNLFDLCTGVTRTGSYVNPSGYGVLDHIEVETATVVPSTVKYMTDDDPTTTTYTVTQAGNAPPNRTQGVNLVETWYMTISDPSCKGARRISIQMNFPATNANFKVFGFALGYELVDG